MNIALGKRLAGRAKNSDFSRACRQSGFKALQIGGEDGVVHGTVGRQRGQHLGTVGHLRHPLRRHKAADFDMGQPCRRQPRNQRAFVRCRNVDGFVLQPITRADFHQGDASGVRHGDSGCLFDRVNALLRGLNGGGFGQGRQS